MNSVSIDLEVGRGSATIAKPDAVVTVSPARVQMRRSYGGVAPSSLAGGQCLRRVNLSALLT
jgi:hypothetical protein